MRGTSSEMFILSFAVLVLFSVLGSVNVPTGAPRSRPLGLIISSTPIPMRGLDRFCHTVPLRPRSLAGTGQLTRA